MAYPPQLSILKSRLNGQLKIDNSEKPDTNQFRKLINIFYSRNSIHGINNFLRESIAVYERALWLFVIAFTIIGMIYVSSIVSNRYAEKRFETVVDSTVFPSYEVIFPTIIICNQNRLNWNRLEAAKERFMPLEKEPVKVKLFERFIAAFDDFAFGKFNSFANVSQEPLQLLDGVNFSDVLTFMTWTCEEMLTECKWRREAFNCCELFQLQRSELGPCYAFNGVQNEETRVRQLNDPFYPLHNSLYGPRSGLEVKVMIRPEDHIPGSMKRKGIEVMVQEAWIWHEEPFFVPFNTETAIDIDPVIFYHDNNTRGIPSKLRKCVFDDERSSKYFKSLPGYIYMKENCYSQCRQEHLMRYCNCTLDLLFPPGDFPTCRTSDFQCIYRHRDTFRYTKRKGEKKYVSSHQNGMTCKCLSNCYALNYITEFRPSYLPTHMIGNSSFILLDAHYRFDTIMVYKTGLVFSWIDLMVSFGGIAGLFLGCSLISAAEIIYFICIDIPRFVYRYVKDRNIEGRKTLNPAGLQQWSHTIGHRSKNLQLYHPQPNVFRISQRYRYQ